MEKERQLYQHVVDITADYLGPAAERFIDRQIENHLGKRPGRLSRDDLTELMDWLMVSLSLLTEDRIVRDEYSRRLSQLLKEEDSQKS